MDMDFVDWVDIQVIGSDYENKWNLLAGEYKFSVCKVRKSLVFDSPTSVVTIDRSYIKHYGIRVKKRRNYYFFSIGSQSPLGRGDIFIVCSNMDVNEFNKWVRERMNKRKDVSMTFPTLSYQTSASSLSTRSESSIKPQKNRLKGLSQFLKSLGRHTFPGKKITSSSKKPELPSSEEYSELSDETTACLYQDLQTDASDTETGGMVLHPSFRPPSEKEVQGKKWHEREEVYTEYVSEYLIPLQHEGKDGVLVTDSGVVYTLPTPRDKKKMCRGSKKERRSMPSKIGDYYNTKELYYNFENNPGIESDESDN